MGQCWSWQCGYCYVCCHWLLTPTQGSSNPYIKEIYSSGKQWYRLWSDGWIEQGGFYGSFINNAGVTVNLNKAFTTTNYTLLVTSYGMVSGANDNGSTNIKDVSVNSFRIVSVDDNGTYGAYWSASGY